MASLPNPRETGRNDCIRLFLRIGSNPADAWQPAISLNHVLLRQLKQADLNSIAFIRYIGAALLGVDDGVVHASAQTPPQDLLHPSTPLPRRADLYFTSIEELDPSTSIDSGSQRAHLPIHPKDASTRRLSSRKQHEKRQTLSNEDSKLLSLRDVHRCQLEQGDEAVLPRSSFVHYEVAHIVPWRRGDPIFQCLRNCRQGEHHIQPLESSFPEPWIDSLDDIRNLVCLRREAHHAWDSDKVMLLPVPNNAFDHQCQPLPYPTANAQDRAPSARVPSGSAPSNGSEVESRPRHPERATRAHPSVYVLQFKECLAIKPRACLRGPAPGHQYRWPPEWIWSYRFASQMATCFGVTQLHLFLRKAWEHLADLDCRGDTDAETSTTESGSENIQEKGPTTPKRDQRTTGKDMDSTPRSSASSNRRQTRSGQTRGDRSGVKHDTLIKGTALDSQSSRLSIVEWIAEVHVQVAGNKAPKRSRSVSAASTPSRPVAQGDERSSTCGSSASEPRTWSPPSKHVSYGVKNQDDGFSVLPSFSHEV